MITGEEGPLFFGLVLGIVFLLSRSTPQPLKKLAPGLLFFAYCFLNISQYISSDRYTTLVSFGLLGFCLGHSELKFKNNFLYSFVGIVYFVGFLDVLDLQHLWSPNRAIKSIFNHKNEFLSFVTIVLVWSWYNYRTMSKGIHLPIIYSSLLFIIIGYGKAAILSVVVLFVTEAIRNKKYKYMAILATLVGLVVSVYLLPQFTNSFSIRMYIYKSSFYMGLDNFWLGVGGGGFPAIIKNYFTTSYASATEVNSLNILHSAHNIFLQLFASNGIIGLSLFCIQIVASGLGISKLKGEQKDLAIRVGVLILIQSVLGQAYSFSFIFTFILWFYLAKVQLINQSERETKLFNVKIVVMISLIVMAFSSHKYLKRLYHHKEFQYFQIQMDKKDTVYTHIIEDFLQKTPHDPYYLKYKLLQSVKHGTSDEINNLIVELEEYSGLTFDWRIQLAHSYARFNQFENCIKATDQVLKFWKEGNSETLNLKAYCLVNLDCNQFLKWKAEVEIYLRNNLDEKTDLWKMTTCSFDDISKLEAQKNLED